MPRPSRWDAVRAYKRPRWWGWAVWLAILVPGTVVLAGLVSDFVLNTRWLGSNPIKEGEQLLGKLTIKYLVAMLAVTPLRRLLGWNWLARDRRTLGLAAFFCALTHFLWFALLDIQLDGAELAEGLTKRPYIIVGFIALLLMAPLALTSTRGVHRAAGEEVDRAAPAGVRRAGARRHPLVDVGEGRHWGADPLQRHVCRAPRLALLAGAASKFLPCHHAVQPRCRLLMR